MTVAAWVRKALRESREGQPGTVEAKLYAIADASRHDFPTADREDMLREVEAGQRPR